MAIYRLSIEVLRGQRDGSDNESHAAAVARLNDLQASLAAVPGVIVYPEGEEAPWGVPKRPGTFLLDFDSEMTEEVEADAVCMDLVSAFVLTRPQDGV